MCYLLCREDTCNFACTWLVVLSVLNLWVFCGVYYRPMRTPIYTRFFQQRYGEPLHVCLETRYTYPCVTFLRDRLTHKYARRQTRLLARAHTLKKRIARTTLNK